MTSFSKITIASALWLFNPVVGCSPEPEFEFGEAEMVELMDSVSTVSWMTEQDSVQYEIRFDLSKGDINYDSDLAEDEEDALGSRILPSVVLGSAQACGTRSFLSEAEACIDTTILSVEGTVEVIDVAAEQIVLSEPIDGAISVWGKQLNEAEFWLSGEQSQFDLYSSDGVAFELTEASW